MIHPVLLIERIMAGCNKDTTAVYCGSGVVASFLPSVGKYILLMCPER